HIYPEIISPHQSIKFINRGLETRYQSFNLGHRGIIYGDCVSRVKDQNIRLNSGVLNAILKIKGLSDDLIAPITKKGVCQLFDDLSELDQQGLVRGDLHNTDLTRGVPNASGPQVVVMKTDMARIDIEVVELRVVNNEIKRLN
ncbi:hypothetical protein AG4045_016886, partial [Apium graveolens]